jgi:hypothetical protein
MEREVIISGHKAHLINEMRRMADELEQISEASMHVEGNGTSTPNLYLRFSCEIGPEFATPCVEYREI